MGEVRAGTSDRADALLVEARAAYARWRIAGKEMEGAIGVLNALKEAGALTWGQGLALANLKRKVREGYPRTREQAICNYVRGGGDR